MTRRLGCVCGLIVLTCLVPALLQAHSFSTPYVPPLPFWIYAYGCAAALIVTFGIVGFFVGAPVPYTQERVREVNGGRLLRVMNQCALPALRAGAMGCLLLTILAGLLGSQDPKDNIAMTLFWVLFLLGLPYLTLFFGDVYALVNPWSSVIVWFERLGVDLTTPRVKYPHCLGQWPAFLLYVMLIWMELFAETKPNVLATILIVYTMVAIVAAALFGKSIWFDQIDPFTTYFRLIGKLAPIEYRRASGRTPEQICLRAPFVGALKEPPGHIALILFVLFMLSSTAYDSIHNTAVWVGLFWRNMMLLLQPIWGDDIGKAQSLLMSWYLIYQQAGLLAFPFFYLALYLLTLRWTKSLSRSTQSVRSFALHFCYSLIPIALAYNFAHYYPFLATQVRALPRLLSDPFGMGWDMLGIGHVFKPPPLQMALVWHLQVLAILVGHFVSVYLAHKVAMRCFSIRGQALKSQLPLLLLMVVYTVFGLWILSLPLGGSV